MLFNIYIEDRVWWYMPIISTTQEMEIRKNLIRGQPCQKVGKTLISTEN
jgi:hypothetical protein